MRCRKATWVRIRVSEPSRPAVLFVMDSSSRVHHQILKPEKRIYVENSLYIISTNSKYRGFNATCMFCGARKGNQANSGYILQRNQKEALRLPHAPKYRRQSQIFILSSEVVTAAIDAASAPNDVILEYDDLLPSSSQDSKRSRHSL